MQTLQQTFEHAPDHQILPTPPKYVHMLSWPTTKLVETLGEPFCRYNHRGREILVFTGNSGTITCEIDDDGLVARINGEEERRAATRVVPPRKKHAFLTIGLIKHKTEVVDISAKGIALRFCEDTSLPRVGETVSFCTSLRTKQNTVVAINLPAHIHRVIEHERKVVLLFHTPVKTHSYQALVDYVSVQLALSSLGHRIAMPDHAQGRSMREQQVIKSDLCLQCEDQLCGLTLRTTPLRKRKITVPEGGRGV